MTYDYIFLRKSNGEHSVYYSNGGILTGMTDNPIIELIRNVNIFDEIQIIMFLEQNFIKTSASICHALESGRVMAIDYQDGKIENIKFKDNYNL